MRRIVLDTNCLLQALPTNSPYHKIWSGVLCGEISLCVNTDIINKGRISHHNNILRINKGRIL